VITYLQKLKTAKAKKAKKVGEPKEEIPYS
jgi:hypothetical protein